MLHQQAPGLSDPPVPKKQLSLKDLQAAIETNCRNLKQRDRGEEPTFPKLIEEKDAVAALENLNKIVHGNEATINQRLKYFLQQRWETTKGTALCYTALPRSDLTKLCCAVADYLSAQDPAHPPALSFLMPTLGEHENKITGEDIYTVDLLHLVQEYILSDDQQTLIPLELFEFLNLNTVKEASTDAAVFKNPFTGTPLSANEKDRLINHSAITELMVYHKENFDNENVGNKATLYGAILRLISGLKSGGIHGLKGGQEYSADTRAYMALDEFREFWKKNVSYEDQQRVLHVDTNFATLMAEKILNPEWVDACVDELSKDLDVIADRQRNFYMAILDCQQQQSQADAGGSQVASYSASNFQTNKTALKDSLAQHKYQGSDRLLFSAQQIQASLKPQHLQNYEDVIYFLKDLKPAEIEIIVANFKKSIVSALRQSMNNVIYVILGLGVQQVKPFVANLADNINFMDLGKFSDAFTYIKTSYRNPQAARAFLEGIQERLEKTILENFSTNPSIFRNRPALLGQLSSVPPIHSAYFKLLLDSMTAEEKGGYLSQVANHLITITKNEEDVNNIFAALRSVGSPSSVAAYLNAISDEFSWHLKKDFVDIFSYLPAQRRAAILTKMSMESMVAVTQSSEIFQFIDRQLPVDKKKDYVMALAKSSDNSEVLMMLLTLKLDKSTIEAIAQAIFSRENLRPLTSCSLERLSTIATILIATIDNFERFFNSALQILPYWAKDSLLSRINLDLLGLTTDYSSFKRILEALQKTGADLYRYLAALGYGRLLAYTVDFDDFKKIVTSLRNNRREGGYVEQLSATTLCSFRINSYHDFYFILDQSLSKQAKEDFLLNMEVAPLVGFTGSVEQFIFISNTLPNEKQKKYLQEIIPDRLLAVLVNSADLAAVLRVLPAGDDKNIFLQAVDADRLVLLTQNVDDLTQILTGTILTSREEKQNYVNKVMEKLPALTSDRYSFRNILQVLVQNVDDSIASKYIDLVMPRLVEQTAHYHDALFIFKLLPGAKQIEYIDRMMPKLPRLTTSSREFSLIYNTLLLRTPEKRQDYLNSLGGVLPALTTIFEDFQEIWAVLSASPQTSAFQLNYWQQVCASLAKNTLSAGQFTAILSLKNLTDAMKEEYLAQIDNTKLVDLTTNYPEFFTILEKLPPERQLRYLQKVKVPLIGMMTSAQDIEEIFKVLPANSEVIQRQYLKGMINQFINDRWQLPTLFSSLAAVTKSGNILVDILAELSVEHRRSYFKKLNDGQLQGLISTVDDFVKIAEIESEIREPRLQKFLYSVDLLPLIATTSHLQKLVQDNAWAITVRNLLSIDKEKLVDKWQELTKNADDLAMLYTLLQPGPTKDDYFATVNSRLPEFTRTIKDFERIVGALLPKDKKHYLQQIDAATLLKIIRPAQGGDAPAVAKPMQGIIAQADAMLLESSFSAKTPQEQSAILLGFLVSKANELRGNRYLSCLTFFFKPKPEVAQFIKAATKVATTWVAENQTTLAACTAQFKEFSAASRAPAAKAA